VPGSLSVLRQGIWPKGRCASLAVWLSVASVISLIRHGFGLSLGTILQFLVDNYEWLVAFAVSPVEPYIRSFVSWIAYKLDWKILLHPHWRHILVLLNLYFIRGAMADRKDQSPVAGFRLFLGLVVGSVTSIAVGAIPLAEKAFATNFLVAFIPLAATSLNDIALRAWRATFSRQYESQRVNAPTSTWWVYFRPAFFGILKRTVVGVVAIVVLLQVPIIWQLKSPGLAVLGLLMLGLAAHQLYLGVGDAKRIRVDNEPLLEAWLRSRGTLIGLGMFTVALWVAGTLMLKFGENLFKPW
jgi:hypothetical protein